MIKPIDEIPKNTVEKRKSYRQMIRNDIMEAIEKGIQKFEFVGDYNYKYLEQYAKEEANRVVRDLTLQWSEDHPEYKEKCSYWFADYWRINKDDGVIKISSVKGETPDKRRVFCEIRRDFNEVMIEHAERRIREFENIERKKRDRLSKST